MGAGLVVLDCGRFLPLNSNRFLDQLFWMLYFPSWQDDV